MSTLCIATRGYLNNTLAIATRGYICDQDGVRGSGGYHRKGYTILSDEEERKRLGIYDKGIESDIKAPQKPEKQLPKAVKIGSYTQTKPYEEYTLKEAENALEQLNDEYNLTDDEDIILQILIHINCLVDICKQIRERDIVFIMAMLNA